MKHLAVTALLAALIPVGIASAGADSGIGADRMQRELGLNDNQTQKVRTIMQEQAEKRRALEEETRQRLSTVLNAEQMERMEKHADKRKGRWGDNLAEELDLTPDQKGAVEKIFSDARSKHDAMDKSDLNQKQMRAQMEALHATTRAQLAGILNADQLARFDEMHSRHMSRMDHMEKHEERREQRHSKPGSEQDAASESEPN